MVETSALRRAGRIDPEGSQWWLYVRKPDCFTKFRTRRAPRRPRGTGARVVRFALSGKVLPMVKDTLRWGDLARRSAMSRYGRRNDGTRSSTLSGKNEESKPLTCHQHAFYLPTDENGDGRLDHLTVWVPGGLNAEEFEAIVSMNALYPGGGRDPMQLVYQAHGGVGEFIGVSDLFCESKRWRSLTPYVLTRHIKYRGPKDARRIVEGPEEQLRREVSLRWPNRSGLSETPQARDPREPIAPVRTGRHSGFRPIDFFRYRRGGGSNGGGAYNFEIEFSESVRGPIALGFACHYGLGLFVPAS